MTISRRHFLKCGSGLALAFSVGGCLLQLSPRQARQEGLSFNVLSAEQAHILEAFGERLVPGSRTAGLAHYIDHQLNAPEAEQLLMIKYLGVEAPFVDFYRQGVAALEHSAMAGFQRSFEHLTAAQSTSLITALAAGTVEQWTGPPAALFYLVVRNDAFDVVYGTQAGFSELGLPYMAHIEPPSRWGE